MRKSLLSSLVFLTLLLLPLFVQAFGVDRNLAPSEFYAAYRDASAGWRIEGSFSTDIDIEFFICDAGNYTIWERYESAILFERNEATTGLTFNFTIPHDGVWYVVFSNVQSPHTTSLEAELFFKDLSNIERTQVTWITKSTILSPAFIGLMLAVPVILLLGVWISRKSEPFPAVRYDEILKEPK